MEDKHAEQIAEDFKKLTRVMRGEGSDEDHEYLQKRSAKYELVRYIYMEKKRADGENISDFQFTPGSNFMEAPVYDIVSSILSVDEKVKNGEIKPLVFDNGKLKKEGA